MAIGGRGRDPVLGTGLSELGATLDLRRQLLQGRTQTMPLAIIGVFDAGKSINVAIALSVILVIAAAILLLLLRLFGAVRRASCGLDAMLSVDFEKRLGDFHLRPRFTADDELVVLLGPSGSGKSLTLRAIAGLLRPDRGRIELAARRVFDSDLRHRPASRRSATSAMWCRTWRCSPT